MVYVDGYVLPVQKKKLAAYKKMAAEAAKIWIKHGALQYIECVGDDLTSAKEWGGVLFPKLAGAKKGETVIFSFVLYKSRSHRDKVNKKIVNDPMMNDPKNKDKPMPFDMDRMAYGGFKPIVNLKA